MYLNSYAVSILTFTLSCSFTKKDVGLIETRTKQPEKSKIDKNTNKTQKINLFNWWITIKWRGHKIWATKHRKWINKYFLVVLGYFGKEFCLFLGIGLWVLFLFMIGKLYGEYCICILLFIEVMMFFYLWVKLWVIFYHIWHQYDDILLTSLI